MNDLERLQQLICTRRAVRRYRPDPIPLAQLTQLLETAMWSPSAHNRQPWRFAIITDPERKIAFAQGMGERLRQDRTCDGDALDLIERDVRRSYERLIGAPALILIALSMTEMDHYADERRRRAEETMAIQSVAMCVQNFWLLAHAAGLSACWLCGPLFVPDLVREQLALPADWQAQGLLTVGYGAEQKVKDRAPSETKIRYY